MESGKIYKILSTGFKVYPVVVKGGFNIVIEHNGKSKKINKLVKSKEVNDAIDKTLEHYYKIIFKQNQ
jgi:hypothetical protein